MLIGVIQKNSMAEMRRMIDAVDASLHDLLELRLDGCGELDASGVASLLGKLPVILTLRTKNEGGAYAGSEESRLQMLAELMRLKPEYIDLEASIPAEEIARIREISPETQVILSWHDFSKTPDSLEERLEAMQFKAQNVIYKIAAYAHSGTDCLRMLKFCREQSARGIKIIGISMGEHGVSSRILAPVVHTGFCYCPLEESTAPGQLTALNLAEVYNFKSLSPSTSVYGLIGDPVEQSVGHEYHNRKNREHGCDAVYVKWKIVKDALPEAMGLFNALGVIGVSATMPLKEDIMVHLAAADEAALEIGAANTLKLTGSGYMGTNTDGPGALNALGLDVAGKRIAILGAGGAARAVIHEAARRGAAVEVFNRTAGKAMPGGIYSRPFSDILDDPVNPHFDVVINALPFDVDFPFERLPLGPGLVAMDISYGKESLFLELAARADCRTVEGYGMFTAQADLQRRYWGLPV